jgi:hypothetical protein
MAKESLAVAIIEIILGVVLVGGMFGAGWNVYRRLPSDGSEAMNFAATDSRAETKLTVMLRREITGATLNSPVEIYPFDLVAAQREFQATPHLARQFDDFLLRRMHGITPVKATTDNAGRAVAILSEGNWWLRATAVLSGGETIEWRLPINIAGREQTVELTMDNAYERTKKF